MPRQICGGINITGGDKGLPSSDCRVQDSLVMATQRGRRTKFLRELAEERFHGCQECWADNAVWDVEEVLRPLRLRQNERKRLMRVLTCPRCESPIRDYWYDRVVGYEANEIRDARRIARYNHKYQKDFNAFHRFLLKHPTLGGCHPFGQLLAKAIRRARKRTLHPATWFRAKEGESLAAADLAPADPRIRPLRPGRFNCAGQLGYYMAQSRELAAVEVQGSRQIDNPIWVSEIHIHCPMKVLNLEIQIMGNGESLPIILAGLIYTGVLSDYGDDESKPQYRVPQFLADLLRERMFDGILYTRRRDSGFPNYAAWGTNLVVLRPENLDIQVAAPVLYSWREVPTMDISNLDRLEFQPVIGDPHSPYVNQTTYPRLD